MSEAAAGKGRVLVVDDDPEIRTLLLARLRSSGYDVDIAEDGIAGLDQARRHLPQVIVLDVMMPNMSGWEVARALKQDPATAGIRILMLTAIGESMNRITSPVHGADAHLDKPFDFAELERMIGELVG